MTMFVDTSALYAAINAGDASHQHAKAVWESVAQRRETLVTSNYVLLETIALLGRRLGLQAVRDFQTQFVPTLKVHWVDQSLHQLAMAAMITAGDRDLSLVDCVSFEVMRHLGLDMALTFDVHFARQGFRCLP
ncbi:MAG: PIN domain-containing protein [Chloroflexi bacterium]|nr:PIN domain-containing protein [Chloroflexota bacterium]